MPAQWTNNERSYGLIARTLHWLVALLFLCAWLAVEYRHEFTVKDTPENWNALQLHLSFGISIGVLMILRVIAHLTQQQPPVLANARWMQISAHAMHLTLYVLMLLMPITGYLGTRADIDYFGLFTITRFPDTAAFEAISGWLDVGWKAFEAPLDAFHHFVGENLLWPLVLVHAGAAVYHHRKLGDDTLRRMTTGVSN